MLMMKLVFVQLVQQLVHVLLFQLFLELLVDELVLLSELVHGYVLALLQLQLSYGSSQLSYLLLLLVQQPMKFSRHLSQLVLLINRLFVTLKQLGCQQVLFVLLHFQLFSLLLLVCLLFVVVLSLGLL